MRRVAYRWASGSLGAGALAICLAACSLVTSLDGLDTGDSGVAGPTGASSGITTADGGVSSSGGGGSGGGSSSSGGTGPVGSSSGSVASGDASDSYAGPDATAPSDEAGNPIPTTEAGTADAGIKDAGSTGTADTAPPPPKAFCAGLSPTPLFCDDFDEGAALSAPWDQLSNTGGTETLSTASVVSSPDAMLVTVNPNAPVTAIDVAGYKSFTAKQGVAGTATVSFSMKINAADPSSSSDAIVGAIQLWNGTTYWDLELEVFYASATNDFKVSMSEDGNTASYVQHFATPHLALGTWTRVSLAITLPAGSGGAAPATMAFDGTTVVSATVHVGTSNPIPEILVGTTYATPTAGGWSVAYDNVTFDEP